MIIVEYYQKRREELIESAELVITGEDPEDGLDEGEKPIRLLSNFSIFDPKHRNEFVSLAAIEEDDGVDRQFEGAGLVVPYFVSEEDEGQDEEEEINPQYVRLGAILRYTIDYAQESEYAIIFMSLFLSNCLKS
jgi:DNA (cytosine-5)-methyltransferase 1